MKAWEKLYSRDVLNEAIGLAEKVNVIENDGVEIIAKVDGFKVRTYIECNGPAYLSCSCSSKFPCKHEAALVYYLKNHPELYLKDHDFDEIFGLISRNYLQEFLLDEFKDSSELKERFLKRFSKDFIDKDYYTAKLDDVFRRGEGRDFSNHGFHDLDLMEDALYDFIFGDISHILAAGEYDFACDLLIRIAVLLNDEVISTYDSWHNLVDRFMEHVTTLEFSIYLDAERLDELYANMNHITDLWP